MSDTHTSLIRTERLDLVPVTVDLIRAEMRDGDHLGRLLHAEAPSGWPPTELADALPFYLQQIESRPDNRDWLIYYWLLRPATEDRCLRLVGSGGFRGAPDSAGTVEVGYGVAPEFRRLGLATEALAGLCLFALRDERVQVIIAHTRHDNRASRAVLEKNGFVPAGDGAEPETMRYELS